MLEREIYRVGDIAAALKLTKQSVFRLIRRKELLAIDLRAKGSRRPAYRVTKESFELYLAQASTGAP